MCFNIRICNLLYKIKQIWIIITQLWVISSLTQLGMVNCWYVRRKTFTTEKINHFTCSWPINSHFHAGHHVNIIIIPLTAKLFNSNSLPHEVVSRWRDPQLQVSENYSHLTEWRSTNFKYWLMWYFIFNMFKSWYVICYTNVKNEYGRHRRLKG